MDTLDRANAIGPTAVAAPGNLMGWCEALDRFGTMPLADAMRSLSLFRTELMPKIAAL